MKKRTRFAVIMKHYFITILLVLFLNPTRSLCQSDSIDFLRNTGKMYSVYAVVLVLFLGIVFYLIHLDKKISKLEKKEKLNEQ